MKAKFIEQIKKLNGSLKQEPRPVFKVLIWITILLGFISMLYELSIHKQSPSIEQVLNEYNAIPLLPGAYELRDKAKTMTRFYDIKELDREFYFSGSSESVLSYYNDQLIHAGWMRRQDRSTDDEYKSEEYCKGGIFGNVTVQNDSQSTGTIYQISMSAGGLGSERICR